MRIILGPLEERNYALTAITLENILAYRPLHVGFVLVFRETVCISEGQSAVWTRNRGAFATVRPQAATALIRADVFETLLVAFVTLMTPVRLVVPSLQAG